MTDFANTFRTLVMPSLRERCRYYGILVSCDQIGLGEACDLVMDEARKRGATYLDSRKLTDLLDWTATRILTETDVADQNRAHIRAEEKADPVGYYTKLTAMCSNPERIKWIFASISPEYRAHLLAENPTRYASKRLPSCDERRHGG